MDRKAMLYFVKRLLISFFTSVTVLVWAKLQLLRISACLGVYILSVCLSVCLMLCLGRFLNLESMLNVLVLPA